MPTPDERTRAVLDECDFADWRQWCRMPLARWPEPVLWSFCEGIPAFERAVEAHGLSAATIQDVCVEYGFQIGPDDGEDGGSDHDDDDED